MLDPAFSRDLPPFLARNPGTNSGFMIAQYTAASLVSENKVLAHPASVDTIPTSGNQEDHVSMGWTAVRKLREVVANVRAVLAVEVLGRLAGDRLPGRARGAERGGRRGAARGSAATSPTMDDDRNVSDQIVAVDGLLGGDRRGRRGGGRCARLTAPRRWRGSAAGWRPGWSTSPTTSPRWTPRGWWAVVVDFEGRVTCARFADVRDAALPGRLLARA